MPILSSLVFNEYTFKDYFAIAEEITKADCNYAMASLDVESLFTNIPLEETIENCVNDLLFNKSKIHNMTKQDVYDLLPSTGKESFLISDNYLYRQKDGVLMGSNLDPTLTNTFLCHHEREWLDGCPIKL